MVYGYSKVMEGFELDNDEMTTTVKPTINMDDMTEDEMTTTIKPMKKAKNKSMILENQEINNLSVQEQNRLRNLKKRRAKLMMQRTGINRKIVRIEKEIKRLEKKAEMDENEEEIEDVEIIEDEMDDEVTEDETEMTDDEEEMIEGFSSMKEGFSGSVLIKVDHIQNLLKAILLGLVFYLLSHKSLYKITKPSLTFFNGLGHNVLHMIIFIGLSYLILLAV